jgi:putative transposase
MSRLRRMVASDRWFFVTCRAYRLRGKLNEAEFGILAEVVRERRKAHRFLLAAWVFLPDHWHAVIFPRSPLTISTVMESIKVGGTKRIHAARGERGVLMQGRFFDRALRTVKEYNEKITYTHGNPVKAGWAKRAEDWKGSSVRDYTGSVNAPSGQGNPIPIDRILMPSDERRRISDADANAGSKKVPQSFKKRNSALPALQFQELVAAISAILTAGFSRQLRTKIR